MQTRFFRHSAASRFGLMVLVAASLMLWLPATLASAQTQGDDVQYNTGCQNIIGAIGNITQTQVGTSTATAVDEDAEENADGNFAGEAAEDSDGEADAQAETDAEVEEDEGAEEVDSVEQGEAVAGRGVVAEVAQEQGVAIEQVNECLNGGVGTIDDTGDDTDADTDDGTAAERDVLASTIPEQKVLANTGGPALLLPVLGLLLISSVAIRNILQR
jgi:hypothetical protein